MSFRNETMAFHQERIRVLQLDIEHLERVVVAHTATASDGANSTMERAYARTSARRSQTALEKKRALLEEFQRGAVNFSIISEEAHSHG